MTQKTAWGIIRMALVLAQNLEDRFQDVDSRLTFEQMSAELDALASQTADAVASLAPRQEPAPTAEEEVGQTRQSFTETEAAARDRQLVAHFIEKLSDVMGELRITRDSTKGSLAEQVAYELRKRSAPLAQPTPTDFEQSVRKIVRTAMEGLAATEGGEQEIVAEAFDEIRALMQAGHNFNFNRSNL